MYFFRIKTLQKLLIAPKLSSGFNLLWCFHALFLRPTDILINNVWSMMKNVPNQSSVCPQAAVRTSCRPRVCRCRRCRCAPGCSCSQACWSWRGRSGWKLEKVTGNIVKWEGMTEKFAKWERQQSWRKNDWLRQHIDLIRRTGWHKYCSKGKTWKNISKGKGWQQVLTSR